MKPVVMTENQRERGGGGVIKKTKTKCVVAIVCSPWTQSYTGSNRRGPNSSLKAISRSAENVSGRP